MKLQCHSLHPLPFLLGGVEKRECLAGPQILERVAGKKEVTFFMEGVAIFTEK